MVPSWTRRAEGTDCRLLRQSAEAGGPRSGLSSRQRRPRDCPSDVDVGILCQTRPPATLTGPPFDVAADLSEALGQLVDVVVMNCTPVDLVKRMLRDGLLPVERDRGARIAFEVRARNEYSTSCDPAALSPANKRRHNRPRPRREEDGIHRELRCQPAAYWHLVASSSRATRSRACSARASSIRRLSCASRCNTPPRSPACRCRARR